MSARVAEEIADKWGMTRGQLLEMMVAAFALVAGVGPEECVLVEQRDGLTIRWWFERKPLAPVAPVAVTAPDTPA